MQGFALQREALPAAGVDDAVNVYHEATWRRSIWPGNLRISGRVAAREVGSG